MSLSSQAANRYSITDIKVKDGDTFICTIVLPFDATLLNQTVRCSDYDAWESHVQRKTITYDKDEIARGLKAKKDLEEYIRSAKLIQVEIPDKKYRDVYGRLLLIVYVDGKLLKDYMREVGALRPSKYNE